MNTNAFRQARRDIDSLVTQVLTAVQPGQALAANLTRHGRDLVVAQNRFSLSGGHLFVVSVGKAAESMMQAAQDILGDLIYQGIGITKEAKMTWAEPVRMLVGDHPVSAGASLQATTAVLEFLAQTDVNDIVLCLISGGTSALLTQPLLPLADWQSLNDELLASGCTINEFNLIRRRLDTVKGGGLARAAAPAQVISLILSDVVGSELAAIGSGPTVLSEEPPAQAEAILSRYRLRERLEVDVYQRMIDAIHSKSAGPNREILLPVNRIIGDVKVATDTACSAAEKMGFTSRCLTTHLEGEAREAGKFMGAIALDSPLNYCTVSGGETTVTLNGKGIGGRNLELALAAAVTLEGQARTALVTLATDGDDGPTRAAGAVVTGQTIADGHELGLDARDFLENNDSYTFFKKLDDAGYGPYLIITGPTGTNVNDLVIILKYAN